MKQISVLLARTVWLFNLSELNPKGLNLWPVCEWLIKRYSFASFPKNWLDLNDDKALGFQAGSFVNSKGENITISFAIYNNGISADASSSTDDSEEFLREIAAQLLQEFKLIVPSDLRKASVSQLDVEFAFTLATTDSKLADLADLLSASVKAADGEPRKFDFGVLQLWTEDTNPATSPAYFRFERKIGFPFAENRFFSQAALRTEEHRALLKRFEDSLRSS